MFSVFSVLLIVSQALIQVTQTRSYTLRLYTIIALIFDKTKVDNAKLVYSREIDIEVQCEPKDLMFDQQYT